MAQFAGWSPSLNPGLQRPFSGNPDNSLSLAIRGGWQIKLLCCFPAGLEKSWSDIEAGGCHMEAVLSLLTLFAPRGHVIKFIINAELIWLPWLTLSDFSPSSICLHGGKWAPWSREVIFLFKHVRGCHCRVTSTDIKISPTGFGRQKMTSWAKNGVSLVLLFCSLFEPWQRSWLSRIC